ncbi:MAG: lipid-A-disaccharide synthase [Thiohalomonadales bacterium]
MSNKSSIKRIGIVAGEHSGDMLGAGLVEELKRHHPDVIFEGIAGPLMQQQGVKSLYSMERLSVMGLMEILGRYFELRKIQSSLIQHFIQNPPDVFIGIDAPDFTLKIERALKQNNIKTVHYGSPSVWAWRQYRVKRIKLSTDLMLCLFPFEKKFYDNFAIPAVFVGHPLADSIPEYADKKAARKKLSINEEGEYIAILPGSRTNEIRYLTSTFIESARWCIHRRPNVTFLIPLVNSKRRKQFETILGNLPQITNIMLVDGQSQTVMAAADVILLASGTAALEALLLKRPMVVAYKLASLTYHIYKFLSRTRFYSLPNILTGSELVPELIQDDANAERIGTELLSYLNDESKTEALIAEYRDIHRSLKKGASVQASKAILESLSSCESGR